MKVGWILPNFGPHASREDLLATARSAERLGFDSVWATDHLLLPRADASRFGHIYEALTTLAFLASTTERIRLGVSSLVLPMRDPILVAKQIAALDALSSGRSMLCVSVGWSAGEYANLGQSFTNRGRRLDEAIHVLRLLWSGPAEDGITFQGRHYAFTEGISSPLPSQPGGPPIWIGGNSPAAIRRAAALGDGWHATSLTCDALRSGAAALRAQAGDRQITVSLRVRLSFRPAPGGEGLQGTPVQVIDSLQAYLQAGLDYPVISPAASDPAEREDDMARFVDEVLPALDPPHRG